MQYNSKVSIIIPVYNGSDYVREAIDSALAQSYPNLEIIVVNDGSSDEGKTETIAKSYGEKIRYFVTENGGVASALNFGIGKMTGKYFSWLSHDDVYYPHKIETQMRFLGNCGDNVILYSDYDLIDANARLIGSVQTEDFKPEQLRYFLTVSHPINGCTSLIPRHCFEKCGLFDETLLTTQDYDLWFRFAAEFKFMHMKERLILSRIHPGQGTHAQKPMVIKEINSLLTKFVSQLSPFEITAATGKSLGLSYAKIAFNFSRRGFYAAALAAMTMSAKHQSDQRPFEKVVSRSLLSALCFFIKLRKKKRML
jgi:glycosyltransferase involved in cell wall biosynthesis